VTSFSVRIPFAGEAVSVFKTVSDLFSYSDPDSTKITRLSDDTVALSLLLDFLTAVAISFSREAAEEGLPTTDTLPSTVSMTGKSEGAMVFDSDFGKLTLI
jgi:hypothetical protein